MAVRRPPPHRRKRDPLAKATLAPYVQRPRTFSADCRLGCCDLCELPDCGHTCHHATEGAGQ